MKSPLLLVQNLQVTVEGGVVIEKLDLKVEGGRVVVIVGDNGSGKSSLAQTLVGDSKYQVGGESKVAMEGQNLLGMSTDERAKAGLLLGWQSPVTIPGVSVFNLCKASYEAIKMARQEPLSYQSLKEFRQQLEELAVRVGLPKSYIGRNVNEGFSGGERKRLEMLQLLLLEPKLAILDEIDSGLDAGGVHTLAQIVSAMKKQGVGFILITHNHKILKEMGADQIWEMKHGRLQARI